MRSPDLRRLPRSTNPLSWLIVLFGLCGATSPAELRAQIESAPVLTRSSAPSGDGGRPGFEWSHTDGFVAIPVAIKRRGDAACLAQGPNLEAVGHHPRARFNEAQIEGGGFLCRPKASGSAPQYPPPRMTSEHGIEGWDRPGAFGALPDRLVAAADRACMGQDARLRAVAFHPDAQDGQGRPIPGGGVFCAPLLSIPNAAR
jgi:hypothetical protein